MSRIRYPCRHILYLVRGFGSTTRREVLYLFFPCILSYGPRLGMIPLTKMRPYTRNCHLEGSFENQAGGEETALRVRGNDAIAGEYQGMEEQVNAGFACSLAPADR